MPFTWTSSTPATRQLPLLVSAPYVAILILPPCPMSVCPPFSALGLRLGPCRTLGVSSLLVLPYSLCPCLSLPVWSSVCSHLLVLGIWLGEYFRTRRQGARAPPLPGSCSPNFLAFHFYLAIWVHCWWWKVVIKIWVNIKQLLFSDCVFVCVFENSAHSVSSLLCSSCVSIRLL